MHKKKHKQFKHVGVNSHRGFRYGGVLISAYPSYYWGGGGMVTSTGQGNDSQNPAENGSGAEGSDSAGSIGDAGGAAAMGGGGL